MSHYRGTESVCPQRIIKTAHTLLDQLLSYVPDSAEYEELCDAVAFNLEELDGLGRALYRDGIHKIKEA